MSEVLTKDQKSRSTLSWSNTDHDNIFLYKVTSTSDLMELFIKNVVIFNYDDLIGLQHHHMEQLFKKYKGKSCAEAAKDYIILATAGHLETGWSRKLLKAFFHNVQVHLVKIFKPTAVDLQNYMDKKAIQKEAENFNIENINCPPPKKSPSIKKLVKKVCSSSSRVFGGDKLIPVETAQDLKGTVIRNLNYEDTNFNYEKIDLGCENYENKQEVDILEASSTQSLEQQNDIIPQILNDLLKLSEQKFKEKLSEMFDLNKNKENSQTRKLFAKNIQKSFFDEDKKQLFIKYTIKTLIDWTDGSAYEKLYPDMKKAKLGGLFTLEVLNIAVIINHFKNNIQDQLKNRRMILRIDIVNEDDFSTFNNFISVFNPNIQFLFLELPNKVEDNKLKETFSLIAKLPSKIAHAFIVNSATTDYQTFSEIVANVSKSFKIYFRSDVKEEKVREFVNNIEHCLFECDVVANHIRFYHLSKSKVNKNLDLTCMRKESSKTATDTKSKRGISLKICSKKEIYHLKNSELDNLLPFNKISVFINNDIDEDSQKLFFEIISRNEFKAQELEVFNIKNVKEYIDELPNILKNIGYKIDFRTNTTTTSHFQQECCRTVSSIMENCNENKSVNLSFRGAAIVIKGSKE